jgi:signal peptidase complex subunit 2
MGEKKEKELEPSKDGGSGTEPRKKEKKEKKAAERELTQKQTALGDTATIKRLMDDAVIEILLDKEGAAFTEDTSMSNLKLLLGFSAVGASLLSHVYPGGFPRNWWCLLSCCTFYFVMSGILQLLLSFVELESILQLNGKTRADGSRQQGINVSSSLPRFQEIYTLGFTPLKGGAFSLASSPKFRPDLPGGNTDKLCHQKAWSVEEFFDEEGTFAEEEFMDVRAASPATPTRIRLWEAVGGEASSEAHARTHAHTPRTQLPALRSSPASSPDGACPDAHRIPDYNP